MAVTVYLLAVFCALASANGPMRRYRGCAPPSTTTTTGTTGTGTSGNPMGQGPPPMGLAGMYMRACGDMFKGDGLLTGAIPASFLQSMMPPPPQMISSNMGGQNSFGGPNNMGGQPGGFGGQNGMGGPPRPPGMGGPGGMGPPQMNDTIKLQMQGYDRQICPTFKTLVQQLGISQTIMALYQPPAQITTGQAVPPNYIGPCCDMLCFCDDLAAAPAGALIPNTTTVCGGTIPPPTPPPMPQPGQNSGFGMPQTGYPNNNNNNQGTVNTFGQFPPMPNTNNQGTFSGFNNNVFPAPPTFGNNNGNAFPQPTFNAQAGRDAWGRQTGNSAPVVPNAWANAGRK